MTNSITLDNNVVTIVVSKEDSFDFDNNFPITLISLGKKEVEMLMKSQKDDIAVEVVKHDTIATKGFKTIHWNWTYCEKLNKSVMVECEHRRVKAVIMKDVLITSKDLGLECKILNIQNDGSILVVSLQITK